MECSLHQGSGQTLDLRKQFFINLYQKLQKLIPILYYQLESFHKFSTVPSGEWLNLAGGRLSHTCALSDVRFSCISSNFLIHFGLNFAVKSPSCNVKTNKCTIIMNVVTN